LGIGDWGLGIGDWGLGPIPNPQSPKNYFLFKKININKILFQFLMINFFKKLKNINLMKYFFNFSDKSIIKFYNIISLKILSFLNTKYNNVESILSTSFNLILYNSYWISFIIKTNTRNNILRKWNMISSLNQTIINLIRYFSNTSINN